MTRILDAGATPLVVGGDHSISLPCLRAAAKKHGRMALVQFDAHIDTWGDYFGGKYFHGSPFRRAIEEELIAPAHYVQVGIRGPMYGEDEDFKFQRDLGVTTIDIGMVKRDGVATTMTRVREIVGSGALYVTFDIDSSIPPSRLAPARRRSAASPATKRSNSSAASRVQYRGLRHRGSRAPFEARGR